MNLLNMKVKPMLRCFAVRNVLKYIKAIIFTQIKTGSLKEFLFIELTSDFLEEGLLIPLDPTGLNSDPILVLSAKN